MKKTRKVYDFNLEKTKSKLLVALKKQRRESTIADLISASGLPKYQVEQAIKYVSDEYNGHMRVTESGEILYYFPSGFKSRYRGFIPRAKRIFKRSVKIIAKISTFLFKIWTMVMLVGYFILFVGILLLAIAASLAMTFAGRGNSRSRGGGMLSFFLVARVFQIFTWIWLASGSGSYRSHRGKGRALHKSIFAFLFGEEYNDEEWREREKRYIIAFVRGRKGVLTQEELMVLSGRNSEEAQSLLNSLLLEFGGEPSVTGNGTLIYLFPELLKSRAEKLAAASKLPVLNPEKRPLVPSSNNSKKVNRWIGFFNGFNILFSSYFLYYSLTDPAPIFDLIRGTPHLRVDFAYLFHFLKIFLGSLQIEEPTLIIFIVLGIIPLIFSALFFLIPLIRNAINKKKNESIKKENFRKKIYFHVMGNADRVDPREIQSAGRDETPANAVKFKSEVLDSLAARKYGEIEDQGDRTQIYKFPEIDRELLDVEEYRKSIDLNRFDLGETVFDSGDSAIKEE